MNWVYSEGEVHVYKRKKLQKQHLDGYALFKQ